MKLKLTERTIIEEETDIDLPIYLYQQNELCDDVWIKWDGLKQTIIKTDWNGTTIESTNIPLHVTKSQIYDLYSEEEFNEALQQALSYFK